MIDLPHPSDSAMAVPAGCHDCRFFIPGDRGRVHGFDGECRAEPPSVYNLPSPEDETPASIDDDGLMLMTFIDASYTGWPCVRRSDWCGHHEAMPR